MYYGCIYKIVNKLNGKVYVGQTTESAKTRWSRHLEKSRQQNSALYAAIRKYGPDAFTLETVGYGWDKASLDDSEIYFVDHFQSMSPDGYNLLPGGASAGKHHDETRAKMSATRKTMWADPEYRSVTRAQMRAGFTEETSQKLSASSKAALTDPAAKAKNKAQLQAEVDKKKIPIVAVCIETKAVKEFESVTACADALGVTTGEISACVSGKQKTAKGHVIARLIKDAADATVLPVIPKTYFKRGQAVRLTSSAGEVLEFASLRTAAVFLDRTESAICTAIAGRYPTVKGYKAEYILTTKEVA